MIYSIEWGILICYVYIRKRDTERRIVSDSVKEWSNMKIWRYVDIEKFLQMKVEKVNVTGANWNQQVDIRSVTSRTIWIKRWIGTEQKVGDLNGMSNIMKVDIERK